MPVASKQTVAIRASYHKELINLAELTGHKIGELTDLALRLFLRDRAPILRRAAKEINGGK